MQQIRREREKKLVIEIILLSLSFTNLLEIKKERKPNIVIQVYVSIDNSFIL